MQPFPRSVFVPPAGGLGVLLQGDANSRNLSNSSTNNCRSPKLLGLEQVSSLSFSSLLYSRSIPRTDLAKLEGAHDGITALALWWILPGTSFHLHLHFHFIPQRLDATRFITLVYSASLICAIPSHPTWCSADAPPGGPL